MSGSSTVSPGDLRRSLEAAAEQSRPHPNRPIEGDGINSEGGAEDPESALTNSNDLMWPQVLSCVAATSGSFLMGTAIGWSGPALSLLRSNDSVRNDEFPGVLSQTFDIGDAAFDYVLGEGDVHVSDVDASLIASLMPVGALVGGSSCGFFIGRYGRRTTMFFLTLGFALSYLFLVAASGVWSLFAGRFLTGFCTGAVSVAAPVYVAETASIRVRGTLGSGVQLMVTLGVLYVDCMGLLGSWRWLSVACVAFTLVWGLLLLLVPESPAYLLSKRKYDDARRALQFLRGHPYIDGELSEMQRSVDQSLENSVSFKELFTQPQHYKPLLISMALMFGQQLSGVNAVLFFSVSIFEAAGTPLNSFVEAIVVASVQVLGTVVAAFAVDRLGRRKLLNSSALIMALSQIGLGTYFWILDHDRDLATNIGFLPLSCLCIFIFFFSIGFGPVPWLMMGELFGQEVKEQASAISASFNWTLAFLVTQFYAPLASSVGTSYTFWLFGALLCGIFVFCLVCVPETKGKTLGEIQQMFRPRMEEAPSRNELLINDELLTQENDNNSVIQ